MNESSSIPPIYPMPWTFWKAPGKAQVPQRYMDLTKNITDAEISRSAKQLWMQTIKLARSKKLKDPWARIMTEYDALYGNKWEKIKRMFPGLGLGVGAFSVYYIYEKLSSWKRNKKFKQWVYFWSYSDLLVEGYDDWGDVGLTGGEHFVALRVRAGAWQVWRRSRWGWIWRGVPIPLRGHWRGRWRL